MFALFPRDWSNLLDTILPEHAGRELLSARDFLYDLDDMELKPLGEEAHIGCLQRRGAFYFCALLPVASLWPGMTFLEQHPEASDFTRHKQYLHLFVEQTLVRLQLPFEALLPDKSLTEVLAIKRSCIEAPRDAFDDQHLTLSWSKQATHVVIMLKSTLMRAELLGDTPEEDELQAMRERLQRLVTLAHTACATPVFLPQHLGDLFLWLDQRFLQPDNYPRTQDGALAHAYMSFGTSLLDQWWADKGFHTVWQKAPRGKRVQITSFPAPEDAKLVLKETKNLLPLHAVTIAMARRFWKGTRLARLEAARKQIQHRDRGVPIKHEACALLHALPHPDDPSMDPIEKKWFTMQSLSSSMKKTPLIHRVFPFLGDELTRAYFLYTLARQLRAVGFEAIEVRADSEGNLSLYPEKGLIERFQHDERFGEALYQTTRLHPWPANVFPDALLEVLTHRLHARDRFVTPVIFYHPRAYDLLLESARTTPAHGFELLKMFPRYHGQDPGELAHLVGLSDAMLDELPGESIHNLYRRILRAPPSLRAAHPDFISRVILRAVQQLGALDLQELDTLLVELRDPHLMRELTAYREGLSAVDFAKRHAIAREQEQATRHIAHAGLLTLAAHPEERRGALSTLEPSSAPFPSSAGQRPHEPQ